MIAVLHAHTIRARFASGPLVVIITPAYGNTPPTCAATHPKPAGFTMLIRVDRVTARMVVIVDVIRALEENIAGESDVVCLVVLSFS